MAEIIFRHVTKMFRDNIALENASFEIEKGEFVFIIGKSGAGKSTILNLIRKQEEVTSGEIIVSGRRLQDMGSSGVARHRRRLGIMSAEVGMLNDRTVCENIRFAILATGRSVKDMDREVKRLLGLVGLVGKSQSYPKELSGGELARALLARALSVNPEVLIADEPTANLDPDTAWDLMQLFEKIHAMGMTVIMATHARDLVTIMRKRVIALVAGVIVSDRKNGIYDQKATDIFEERRVLAEREARKKEGVSSYQFGTTVYDDAIDGYHKSK